MIELIDGTVHLWRYELISKKSAVDGETYEEIIMYATSEEEKEDLKQQYPEATITPVDQTGNEWINGMKFDSIDRTYKALEMGQEAYKAYLLENDFEIKTAAYLVDLDSRILMLEWGLS